MRWGSVLSELRSGRGAVDEATAALAVTLGGPPDLVFLFASSHHLAAFPELAGWVREPFPSARVVGCSGGGVIGAGRELEDGPALSLVGARLPRVELRPFHVAPDAAPPPLPADLAGIVLLVEPFTGDAVALLDALDRAHPGVPKVGGQASGGHAPGAHALFLDGACHPRGAVGVALSGDVDLSTVVAQGCRPIGQPMLVTRCEGSLILELNQRRPLDVMRELVETLSPEDARLFMRAPFLGIEMREEQVEKRAGDFLVRHVVGLDPERGALAVGDTPRRWQAVQFHLRDARTSAEDLDVQLARAVAADPRTPAGALLFACLGRGAALYGHADHDATAIRDAFGPTPVGGFFCSGELGPVGDRSFVHGYTSAIGLFRPRRGA